MTSPFPTIDGGVVNAPPTDPNQPQSPTGITPPLGTAARSQATGTPVPPESIQHSNQRANTHISPFQSAEDFGTPRSNVEFANSAQKIPGGSFGQQQPPEKAAAGEIPFPQAPARHSGERERGGNGEEDPDAHLHRISSNGPVSSHSHLVTCTETHPKDERSVGERAKESASGAKGLVAAVHGVGEKIRGGFNAGVDRAFNDVCEPHGESFPHLGVLEEWKCDEDGEGEVWREESVERKRASVDSLRGREEVCFH